MKSVPFSVFYDLSDLSDGGAEILIAATAEQRAKLAEWAGVDSVEAFDALVELKRRSATRFVYEATLTAGITQSCVVTLEPVHSHLALNVSRRLRLDRLPPGVQVDVRELSSAVEEVPEEIQESRYDLAGPLLEEFSLALDPYPRAPGVVFKAPKDGGGRVSPFDVLKPLKKGD